VKSGGTDAAVEFLGVEFDVVEIVLEGLLADEFHCRASPRQLKR
jgi:hypothetical protein